MRFERNTIAVNFKLRESDIARVDELADGLNLSRSDILRRAVVEGLGAFKGLTLPGCGNTSNVDQNDA